MGSTFLVTTLPEKSEEDLGTEKKSILLVDPDPDSTRTLFVGLVRAGHSVTDTSKGDYALEILKHRSFEVALIDVMLSRVGDVDLIGVLRKDWSNPLIIVTADFALESVRKAVIRRGANQFVQKPVELDRLLSLISPTPAFSGHVEGVDILEYLQFMLLTGKRTIVEIQSNAGSKCRLFLTKGNIIHAVCGDCVGEDAVIQCVKFRGGSFSNLPWTEPERATIDMPGESLLIDLARRRDET